MRRVLDPALWLKSGDCLPQIGGPAAQLGYMAKFEWNGADYESHSPCSDVPVSWASRRQLAVEFRKDWIRAHEGKKQKDEPCDPYWEASTTGNRSPSGSSSSFRRISTKPFAVASAKRSQMASAAAFT